MSDQDMVRMNGKLVPGCVVSFNPVLETWNEYTIEDGTVIRMRTVVTRVVRMGEPGPDGGPAYFVSSNNVLDVQAPDALWQEPPTPDIAPPGSSFQPD